MGAASCMILSSWGSAWGTWRAGLGVCHMGIDHPAGIIKNIVPIVMAGVLGIYGLIVAVIITQAVSPPNTTDHTTVYSQFNGYTHVRDTRDSFLLFGDRGSYTSAFSKPNTYYCGSHTHTRAH
jgi:ATP synthase proteolipid subunit